MPIINIRISGTVKSPEGKEVREISPDEALEQEGPILEGVLAVPDAMQKASNVSSGAVKSQTGFIMLDTGASCTCFDIETATDMGLAIVGRGSITSASHDSHPTPLYAGRLIFGGMNMAVNRGLGANLKSQGLIALVGRDILRNGILIYNGTNGSVSLAIT